MQKDLDSLARDGVLRVAINTGNGALVQQKEGVLSGISPALAARLADQIGARMQSVVYGGAGKVFADVDQDAWDVAFLAVDATRAEKIAYTRAYVTIEATYAVRAGSRFQNICDVDSPDTHVLTALGSAYDMHLTETLKHASLERSGTPSESFAEFRDGRCDAVAGVRASLMQFFANDPHIRLLPGVLTKVEQAMVLPDRRDPRIVALDAFVSKAMEDGFVAQILSQTTTK